jgi:hypothetical protein
MAFNRTQAQKLCTKAEFELFVKSLPAEMKDLTRAQVLRKLQSARRLRDKQQDLFRRQRLASRDRSGAKDGKSGIANVRTEQKLALFGEVLARFEKRLDQLDKAAAKAQKAAQKAAKPVKETSKSAKTTTPVFAKDKRLGKSNVPRKQAHSAARNRRDQGRKDNRRG